ncbi:MULTISPECIES: Holliday junction branch migration protein RuvA [unclassified Leptolyngbya]|uniref:Holliday junction branch migration protein RuvA n=1 Tax=unclassified Leptolyngbya TaxID=2650499 RepID=UPI001684729A|nr:MULTISPECIES: Holliday junction branch migration protein RuvA [unclassified Leptolyngbya]MBD1911508.1 Holliday junction branch migration protein RuvA [Leptolyngbya sp. FACHB-8]MBD2155251.1 Holliday junction branch migration protein RuvA [Leptolyngbya sp. FACHB-16]
MLSYLKGTLIGIQKISANRVIAVLEVSQVGYEIQIVPRLVQSFPSVGETVQVFTHQQVREDQIVLFGFASMAERDLFRQLLSVSGIGPQAAIALLDTLGLTELVQAIVTSNIRALSRAPGVGTRTAERLAVELKTKLAEWRNQSGLLSAPDATPVSAVQEDVEMTLLALGYSNSEILQALQAVGQEKALAKNADAEVWIREAIAWLSR